MGKQEPVVTTGRVLTVSSEARCLVVLDSGNEVLAYLSGKMRKHRRRLIPGGRVRLELSPYDLRRGRIVGILPYTSKGGE